MYLNKVAVESASTTHR